VTFSSILTLGILVLSLVLSAADSSKAGKANALPANGISNTINEWIEPFNRKDLTGWDGVADLWRVEDGVIVGETTPVHTLDHHSYLIWRSGELSDFELRLQFRVTGKRANSGIQYRSRDLGGHNVAGYQYNIQLNRAGATAVLEEMKNGRGGHLAKVGQRVHLLDGDIRKVVGNTGKAEQINASLRVEDWNELRVRAVDNRLMHWINGHLAVDVVDDNSVASVHVGLLAFQLHSGPPMKIELKQIRLRNWKASSKVRLRK
jgi:hypothetical protein